MEGEAKAIARKAVELALAGDTTAIALILKHVLPRARPVRFALPELEGAADVPKALAIILGEVAAGQLTPDEGAALAGLLDAFGAACDVADLEQRIAELEAQLSAPGAWPR